MFYKLKTNCCEFVRHAYQDGQAAQKAVKAARPAAFMRTRGSVHLDGEAAQKAVKAARQLGMKAVTWMGKQHRKLLRQHDKLLSRGPVGVLMGKQYRKLLQQHDKLLARGHVGVYTWMGKQHRKLLKQHDKLLSRVDQKLFKQHEKLLTSCSQGRSSTQSW